MPAPLIFLDLDGVLNSHASEFVAGEVPLDPVNIAPFNRIVEEVSAEIVITSTWRYFTPLETLRGYLREARVKGRIIDVIPDLSRGREAGAQVTRGEEIYTWFKARGEVDPGRPTMPFVILDDRGDLEPYLDRLILTSIKVGLTEIHADRAIEMLSPSI